MVFRHSQPWTPLPWLERFARSSRRLGRLVLFALPLSIGAAPLAAQPVLVIQSITHTPDPGPVVAGSTTDVVFSFDLRNTATGASDDASNVTLTLLLTGSDLVYEDLSETFSPGSCSVEAGPARLECDLGTMQENSTRTGSLTFHVESDAPAGTLTSTFTLDSDETTPIDQDEAIEVDVEADLVVDKQDPSPNEAVPGEDVVYTIVVTNNGPSDATGIVLTDTGPVTWGAPVYSGVHCGGAPAACNLGTIVAGADKTATVTFAVPDDHHLVVGFGNITNSASVVTATPDAGGSDYDDSVSTPIVPEVDLSVAITNDTIVAAGEPISYTVTVTKTGPSRLSGVLLGQANAALGNVLSQVFVPDEGTFTASPVSPNWFGLDLAGSDSATITLSGWLSPAVTGASFNPQITIAPQPGVTDTNSGNNGGSDSDSINRAADLRIVKTNNLDGVVPGQLVPYTITVFNEGPADVVGATVTDNFPAQITNATWSYSTARELTALEAFADGEPGIDGLDGASAAVSSPDGAFLYVTASADHSIARFARAAGDGTLTFGAVTADDVALGLNGAAALAISPNGGQIYVAGFGENALQVFTRDSGTGSLTALEVHRDGVSGVSGMAGPRGVAVAPDGRHVYVAAATTGALVTFSRDLSTGALTFVSSTPNGGGVSGLGGARAVAVAPDGRHVLVAGETDNAVAYFSRNPLTNVLTFVTHFADGGTGEGLAGASGVAFSPRGDAFYGVGYADNAVVVFSRNLNTGVATYLEREVEGLNGVTGMSGPRGVTVTPDGRTVFVSSTGSGAIAAFNRIQPPGAQAHTLEFIAETTVVSISGAAMSPAGEQLYAVAAAEDRLTSFSETRGASSSVPGVSDVSFSELATLPAQSYVTYIAQAQISGSASGTLVNTAEIAAPVGVTDAADAHPPGFCALDADNNSCTDSDQIGQEADLSVTKTASPGSAVPGELLVYTLVVGNAGPTSVNGVSVVDADLSSPDFASASWSCASSPNAVCGSPANGVGNINHTDVNLPAGGSVTYTITVEIATDASGSACDLPLTGSCVENSATVTLPSSHVDPTPADLVDSVQSPIVVEAELSIVKTVTTPLSEIDAGQPLDYEIVVTNCGPSDVAGVTVQDSFPADYENATWSCVAVNGSCPVPDSGVGNLAAAVDLAGGDPSDCSGAGVATFTIQGDVAVAPSAGTLTNIAKLLLPSGLIDPILGNNTSSSVVGLQATADIAIIKSDGGSSTAVPGTEITYSITVLNYGPDDATQLVVSDLFPPQLRDVTWTCSSEAPAKGTLTFVEEQRQGQDIGDGETLTGLEETRAVVVAPDHDGPGPDPGGRFVYATGFAEGAVTSFFRDGETGELLYLSRVLDGETLSSILVDGLQGASGLAVSPDGLNLYVLGEAEDKIATFTRNVVSGSLGFVSPAIAQGVIQPGGTVDGLDGARDLVVSPDGEHVYVTSPLQGSIAVFKRNGSSSGSLSFLQVIKQGTVAGLEGARGLAVSPDGEHVYVAGDRAILDDTIVVFSRDNDEGSPDFGELTLLETLVDGVSGGDYLGGASDVTLSAGGDFLYATASADNAVSVFSRNTNAGANFGRLTFLSEIHEGVGASGIEGAVSADLSADGQHLYVAALASDSVAVFQRNSATGGLKFIEARRNGVPGDCVQPPTCTVQSLGGAATVALDPAGTHVYVAAYQDSAISVFARAGAPPAFAFGGGLAGAVPPAPVVDDENGVTGLDAVTDLAIAGTHLYAVSFEDASVVTFSRDPISGELTFLQELSDGAGANGLAGASAVAVYDQNVYVVSQSVTESENRLVSFTRDTGTGLLTFLGLHAQGAGGVSGMFGAVDVAVSSDGKNVYVAGRTPGSIAVFTRDTITGALTFLQSEIANQGGVVGLQGAHSLAFSGDDAHLYVASSIEDSVAVFERDALDGSIAQIQVLSGIPALDRAIGIATSREVAGSRNVYVAGHTADSLAVFARDIDSTSDDFGKLTLLESFTDEVGGVEGLDGARSVTVSPDGKQVYVAGEDDDALAVFAREESGGSLVFVEARVDGQDGVDGLDQAYSVVVSANNLQAYVAGFGEDSIALFTRTSGSRCTGAGAGSLEDSEVEIAAGGQVVYTITATIDPAATGDLVNEAHVEVPISLTQPTTPPSNVHPSNVCVDNVGTAYPDFTTNDDCRDLNLLTPQNDLVLDKSDGETVAIPGEELTYTIVVENDGPSNVVGATVSDVLTDVFPDGATWSCVAAPSGALSFADSVFDGVDGVDGLEGAAAVAISPDGLHVYSASRGDDALTVFELDQVTGELTQIELHRDGELGVDGLDGATAIAISNDGTSVYVAGQIDDAVSVFSRVPATGALTFLELQQGPLVAGLDAPVALALDSAGDNLYVAAANSNAVTVFDRNTVTGALTFLETLTDGVASVDGLAGASGVAVSADDLHVYATGENDGAVTAFSRSLAGGALTYLQSKFDGQGGNEGLAGARGVAVSPDGANVYVAGAGESAIAVFSRDTTLGTLTFRQAARDGVGGVEGLAGVTGLAVSHDGGAGFHVYAAGSAESAISVLRRDVADFGRLTFVSIERDGFGGVDGLDGIDSIAIAPSGAWVVAAGAVDHALAAFARPTDSSCSGGSDFTPGDGIILSDTVDIAAGSRIVYSVTGVVDADLCTVYPCAATLSNEATVSSPTETDAADNGDVDVDALSPRANLSITKTDGVAVVLGIEGASAVALSPGGSNLYATGLLGDGVAVFSRDLITGALTFRESERDGISGVDGLNGAAGVVVSVDGRHVYVAGSADNAVVVFERALVGGLLTYVQKHQNGFGGVTGLLGASGLAMSSDGRHLYVAGSNSSALAIFARDHESASATFGQLTFLGEVRDGVGGVNGLSLVRAVSLSPDGEHLYAVGESDNALAVFRRNLGTGMLTFLESEHDGVGGVTGIAGARGVAIAPDGAHVYVSGGTANAVAQFSRQTASGHADFGKVTWVATHVDGVGGVDGLQGAAGIVVAPDPPGGDPGGQHLFVTGRGEDAVAVFSRDEITGALTWVAAAREGQAGYEGLAEPSAVALSPDGVHVYVAGAGDGAVVTSLRDWDWNGGTPLGTGEIGFVDSDAQGDGTAAPGQILTYEILVTNHGPSTVNGATVTDIFPGELEDVSWVCATLTPGAACLGGNPGTGDLVRTVRLPPGGQVLYTAMGTIKPGVTGTIFNTATVAEPFGFIDLVPSDNSATDSDTVLAREADLVIEKFACSDPGDCENTPVADVVPGTQVHYGIRVENNGPSDVEGAVVTDRLPELLSNAAWTCQAEPVPGLLSPLAGMPSLHDGDDVADVVPACGPTQPLIDGLAGARAAEVAPDGLNVYVAGGTDHAVAAFRRDLRNGQLTFVGAVVDGQTTYGPACVANGLVDGLRGASAIVASPDGQHVYVSAELDDAVSVYSRQAVTGALSFLQFRRDGVGGVNGLGNARGLALSGDGKHLYTAARSDNGVGVFVRDPVTGLLTYSTIRVDGQAQPPLTIDGLAGAVAVAISPDGTSVYVAGEIDDAVAVFQRDAATGALTFVEAEKDGASGVQGLDGARALAVSGDGLHLYVASGVDDAVAVFARDGATGALTFVEAELDGVAGAAGLDGASGVRVSADGEQVYVTGASANAVAVFARDAQTGALTPLPPAVDGTAGVDGLSGAFGLALPPDDAQVYAAGAGENGLSLLRRGAGSRCTPQGFGDIVDTVDVTSGGNLFYLLSADLSPAASGDLPNLALVEVPGDVAEIDDATNSSLHSATIGAYVDLTVTKTDFQTEAVPGLPLTYTIEVTNNGPSDLVGATVEDLFPAVFGDPAWSCVATEALAFVESETNGIGSVAGLDAPYGVAVAPDPDGFFGPEVGGLHVYTAARASQAIALFERDEVTGALDFVGDYVDGDPDLDGFGGAGGLAISPDGLHLYATGKNDDAVAIFERDAITGELSQLGAVRETDPGVDGLDGAVVVAVSRDGKNVYVGSEDDDALAVFARDAATGSLTFLERWKDGFGGLALGTLDRPAAVVTTADGMQVMVAAADGDRLSVFERDPTNGRLTLSQVLQDGVSGVDGLDLVSAIAVSSGAQYVYAAGLADDAIAIFDRDTETGFLTYLGQVRNGVGGITGLDGVRSLVVSPDGLYLFAAAYNSDALVVFRRDALTGSLAQLQAATDGLGGFAGLNGARAVALDPSGRDIYVAADLGDSVAVLSRVGQGACAVTAADGDLSSTVDLAVGATATFTALGSIDPGATGLLENTVTVDVPPGTVNTGDTSATDTDTLTPQAELSITKTDGVTSISAGSSTIYLISVANSGPSHAPASLVEDTVPPEVVAADWTCDGDDGGLCNASGSGSISESVDLPAGGSVVFALTATIDGGAVGTVTNTATVTPAAGVTDLVPGNNSATDVNTIAAEADLGLLAEADDAVVQVGEPVVFTLTLSNSGPAQASGITLTNLLPPGATLEGVTAAGWSCISAPGSVTCTLAGLNAGAAAPPVQVEISATLAPGAYVNAATVSSTTLDPVVPNNTAAAPFTVVVLEPPSVILLNSDPDSGDGELESMETATVAVTELLATFNEQLFDPAGDGDPADVTNPANYQLVEAGNNGGFTTPLCQSLVGDDVGVAVSSVSFDSGSATATVIVNGGVGLGDGLYRFAICSAPGLEDLDGNALDGNGDLVPGDDFVRHFRVQIENLLQRPHADFAGDLASWPAIGGQPGDYTVDAVDAGAFPLSGSFRLVNLSGDAALTLAQCVTLFGGVDSLVLSGLARIDGAGAATLAGGVAEAIEGPCLAPTSILATWETSTVQGSTAGLFRSFSGVIGEMPPAATSLRVTIGATDLPGNPIDVRLDRLSLIAALFADGFETGDTSRWSGVTP